MPEFASPVRAGYPTIADASFTLTDVSATAKTLIRSDRTQFEIGFGESRRHGDALVAGTRPDEWLILGTDAQVEAAKAGIDRDGFTSVIPFTHGRALFRVTGADSAAMLEKVCGIDWRDSMMPDGAVVSASVALTTCDIIRDDLDGVASYLLMCDRSFGQYLFDSLLDAGAEFDLAGSRS